MHQQIKKWKYHPGLKFFFSTGSLDETHDRNNNGIIDSIDDTLSLIDDLESLGYKDGKDIRYINYEDGKHDMATWARAMPEFLK
jgi:enterochelin esterase-like enzyme